MVKNVTGICVKEFLCVQKWALFVLKQIELYNKYVKD